MDGACTRRAAAARGLGSPPESAAGAQLRPVGAPRREASAHAAARHDAAAVGRSRGAGWPRPPAMVWRFRAIREAEAPARGVGARAGLARARAADAGELADGAPPACVDPGRDLRQRRGDSDGLLRGAARPGGGVHGRVGLGGGRPSGVRGVGRGGGAAQAGTAAAGGGRGAGARESTDRAGAALRAARRAAAGAHGPGALHGALHRVVRRAVRYVLTLHAA